MASWSLTNWQISDSENSASQSVAEKDYNRSTLGTDDSISPVICDENPYSNLELEQARQDAIHRWFSLGLTVEQIAELLSLSVEQVQAKIDSDSQ